MQEIKWCMLMWLVVFVSHDIFSCNCVPGNVFCRNHCSLVCNETFTNCCVRYTTSILQGSAQGNPIEALKNLQAFLGNINVTATLTITSDNFVALLFKPNGTFEGLEIYASETQVGMNDVNNSRVRVQLPKELNIGPENTIVFSMFKLPETNRSDVETIYKVYDQRLVILKVQNKEISGLQEPVHITMKFAEDINETQTPSCQFLNFSTNNFSQEGCNTVWNHGQSDLTCSCDHFTYFGVLMMSASPTKKDQEILTYITLIGCSISLFALVITVLLFITKRALREDVSMKIHVNLAIALILLNVHFLPNQTTAIQSFPFPWLCFYIALALHYSLLATFSWMAMEGFHLYLLLIKIFDISVSRYLLKLSMVGWGVPAVIVSVVVIIDRKFYGHVPTDSSNDDGTEICYITDETVKTVTTTGLFTLVFIFNMTMFMVTIKRVWNAGYNKELKQLHRKKVWQNICSLLVVSALLGVTWGLIFFSFGQVTTLALYLFCVLNSLQGFFIFLWFVMSLRKGKNSAPKTSSETNTTTSKPSNR